MQHSHDISLQTEIRKLRPAHYSKLAELLSPNYWKTVMGNIKKPGSQIDSMFTSEHIAMIETAAVKQRKLASEIFLDEWGTMGRERPTIATMIKLLVEVELFRAADYLAVEVIKGTAPNRPVKGPAAAIQIPIEIEHEYNKKRSISDESYILHDSVIETLDNDHAHNFKSSHDPSNSITATFSIPSVPLLSNLSTSKFGREQHSTLQADHKQACHSQNHLEELTLSKLPLCLIDRAIPTLNETSERDSYHDSPG